MSKRESPQRTAILGSSSDAVGGDDHVYVDDQVLAVLVKLQAEAKRIGNSDQSIAQDGRQRFLAVSLAHPIDVARAITVGLGNGAGTDIVEVIVTDPTVRNGLNDSDDGYFLVEIADTARHAPRRDIFNECLSLWGPERRLDLSDEGVLNRSHFRAQGGMRIFQRLTTREQSAFLRADEAACHLNRWEHARRPPFDIADRTPATIKYILTSNAVTALKTDPVALARALAKGLADKGSVEILAYHRDVMSALKTNKEEELLGRVLTLILDEGASAARLEHEFAVAGIPIAEGRSAEGHAMTL